MKKILIYLLIFVFLFTIFSVTSPQPVSADVTINEVIITPLTEGMAAAYTIELSTSHAAISVNSPEHNIYVQFPSEYDLPAAMNPNYVTISDGGSFSSSPSQYFA